MKYNSYLNYQIQCSNCGKIFENQNNYGVLKKRLLKKGWQKFTLCKPCSVKLGKSYRTKEDEEKSLEKRKQTCLEKYGVTNATYRLDHNQKTKETCLKKYGVENPSQSKEIKKKKEETSLKHFGVKNFQQLKKVKERAKQTSLEKYGTTNPSQSKKIKEKTKQNNFKKYGVEYPSQREEFKIYLRNIWQNETKKKIMAKKASQSWKKKTIEEFKEIQRKRSKKYQYDNQYFDSKPELAFYIWVKDHNLNIKKETKSFPYTYQNKTYYYFPDFEVDGKYYEIKGSQFLTEDNKWQNPFDHSQDEKYEAKHQCALQNGVIILYPKDYKKYIDYIKRTYGLHYLGITWQL